MDEVKREIAQNMIDFLNGTEGRSVEIELLGARGPLSIYKAAWHTRFADGAAIPGAIIARDYSGEHTYIFAADDIVRLRISRSYQLGN